LVGLNFNLLSLSHTHIRSFVSAPARLRPPLPAPDLYKYIESFLRLGIGVDFELFLYIKGKYND
jgi:hypothetical protein